MTVDPLDAVFRRLEELEKRTRTLKNRLGFLFLLAAASLGLTGYLFARVTAAEAVVAKWEQEAQAPPDDEGEPAPEQEGVTEARKLVMKTPEGKVYATLDQNGLTLLHDTGKYAARLARPLPGMDPSLELWDALGKRRFQLALFGENSWLEVAGPGGQGNVRLSVNEKVGPAVRVSGGKADGASIGLHLVQDLPTLVLQEEKTRSTIALQMLQAGPTLLMRDGRGDGVVSLGLVQQSPGLSLRGGGKVLQLPAEK